MAGSTLYGNCWSGNTTGRVEETLDPSDLYMLGVVRIVRGRPAFKLNQGAIRKVTT